MPNGLEYAVRIAELPGDLIGISSVSTRTFAHAEIAIDVSESGFTLRERMLAFEREWSYIATEAEISCCTLLFIAEFDGSIAGWCGCSLHAWNRRWEIAHLYIEPEHRRQGVGRKLIAAAIAAGRDNKCREVWVETQNTNPDACHFYEQCGFQLSGIDTTLYSDESVPFAQAALFYSHSLRRE